jgi:hypothetical protein
MSGPRIIICALAWQIIALFSVLQAFGEILPNVAYQYDYSYANQLGPRGFFGAYNSGEGDFAPLNGWLGPNIVSGANAATAFNAVYATKKWKLNEAIRINGGYAAGRWFTGEREGKGVPLWKPDGHWTTLYTTIETPLGSISFGKRGFPKGHGLQYQGSPRTEEFMILETSATIGGLALNTITYREMFDQALQGVDKREFFDDDWSNPWRRPLPSKGYLPDKTPKEYFESKVEKRTNEALRKGKVVGKAEKYNRPRAYDVDPGIIDRIITPKEFLDIKDRALLEKIAQKAGYSISELRELAKKAYKELSPPPQTFGLTFGFGFYPWKRLPKFRRNVKRYWDIGDTSGFAPTMTAYMRYDNDNFSCGVGTIYSTFHIGPESQATEDLRNSFAPLDRQNCEGWIFLEYDNGKFFLKAESDWFYRIDRWQMSQNGEFFGTRDNNDGSGSLFAPDYIESWRYMLEMGFLFGPLKVSGLYAFMPGPDRRHGVLIDRQPFINDPNLSAQSVFSPYSVLMSSAYGSGVQSAADLGESQSIGLRLDYAVAANLVAYSSFVKSFRSSHGYGYGFIRPDLSPGKFGKLDFTIKGSFINPSPAIPTNDIGWEVGAGFNWQLLNNWVAGLSGAFFYPGDWFKYACIDKRVLGWDRAALDSSNNFGVYSDRRIDPIFQLGISISVSP